MVYLPLQVRAMLEEDTQMELKEYRSFIDEEMFTIMGQMDSASKIFDHVYLVSKLTLCICWFHLQNGHMHSGFGRHSFLIISFS